MPQSFCETFGKRPPDPRTREAMINIRKRWEEQMGYLKAEMEDLLAQNQRGFELGLVQNELCEIAQELVRLDETPPPLDSRQAKELWGHLKAR